MNKQEYIESGILESYALGICSDAEKAEVEKICAENAEIKAELLAVQAAVFSYGQLHQSKPKASLKADLLNQLDFAEPVTTINPLDKIIPIQPKKYPFAVAASLTLFGLSLIGNYVTYTKYQEANEKITALNAEKTSLANNFRNNQVKLEELQANLLVTSNPNVQKIPLKGVEKSPESLVMIYWNKETKEVFMEIKNLPLANAGKQYQLWAIVDGKPVNAGMISVNNADSSFIKMNGFETAQAFAITLENVGGSENPTLTEMYVMGATL
ncbi:MAG: anti-sigma factor [Bacteroidia bacterium]